LVRSDDDAQMTCSQWRN